MKYVAEIAFWLGLVSMLAIVLYFEREERRDCHANGGTWVDPDGCRSNYCDIRSGGRR